MTNSAKKFNNNSANYHTFLQACSKESDITIETNKALAVLCSFNTGGNAQLFCAPACEKSLQKILRLTHKHKIPVTLLGGGSNVLAPDSTLEGLTITTSNCKGITLQNNTASIMCGETIRHTTQYLAHAQKSALEFLYGMPGTFGGAVFMNARCYGKEISAVLISARGYTYVGDPWTYTYNKKDFAYKKSPFQNNKYKDSSHKTHDFGVIVECNIALSPANGYKLWNIMLTNEFDRRHKGHYIYPCAGSVFKNNYNYGKPAGAILDSLGFCGSTQGDAKVSERHANIIVNTQKQEQNSTKRSVSKDIFLLSEKMQKSVYNQLNIKLEKEIIFLGNTKLWKE